MTFIRKLERLITGEGKRHFSAQGIHWFDRNTGLNVLFDEVVVPNAQWDPAPKYLSIALTNSCELSCNFCYAPKYAAKLRSTDVLRWLREFDGAGALGVGFGGGEPTAHPNFVRICREAAQQTRLAITFTTHGHRIDEDLANSLAGNVHFIRVSMDGVGAVYEKIRRRSFADFCRALDRVSRIAPFGINVVLNKETVAQLEDVAQFAVNAGASEILLLPQRAVPGRASEVDHQIMADAGEWISRSSLAIRMATSEMGADQLGVSLAHPYRRDSPLTVHAHIDARGYIKETAYAPGGVLIGESALEALMFLRDGTRK